MNITRAENNRFQRFDISIGLVSQVDIILQAADSIRPTWKSHHRRLMIVQHDAYHRWARLKVRLVCLQTVSSDCFFVNKRTKDKLLFARWANLNRLRKNCLSFHFPFDVFMSPCLCVSMPPCLCLHVSRIPQTETELMENGLFSASGNGNSELLFVCSKRKHKTDVCFP
jgi:hypothetical protein